MVARTRNSFGDSVTATPCHSERSAMKMPFVNPILRRGVKNPFTYDVVSGPVSSQCFMKSKLGEPVRPFHSRSFWRGMTSELAEKVFFRQQQRAAGATALCV